MDEKKTKKEKVSSPTSPRLRGAAETAEWHVLDAKHKILGRLATRAAELLLGKHHADFTKHLIAPVYVVVINAAEVAVTGSKETQKLYRHHSGYPGHLK